MSELSVKVVTVEFEKLIECFDDYLKEGVELAVQKAHEAYVRDNLRPYDAAVNGEELLTRKQAAAVLGISVSTLDSLRRADHIQETYIGTSPRIRRADLQDYINKQKTGGQ